MYTKLRTYIKILLICSFSISAKLVFAQIEIPNASLEDQASDATTPQGWYPCEPNTTPDILPGFWGVYLPAQNGETYVGLISRSDGSFESISTLFCVSRTVCCARYTSIMAVTTSTRICCSRALKANAWD